MPAAAHRRPLGFHTIRGEHVQLSKSNRVARRVDSFCKGVAFSDRPVAIDEIVCLKFAEIAKNWSGVLRFGLTNTDPATLAGSLPKFACPDLTNKEGNWAKAIAERYCQQGSILHFYVRENGELYYGINGVQKGLFLSSINTRLPLWVMLDIYGNCTCLEFLDPAEVPPLRRHNGSEAASSSQSTPARNVSSASQQTFNSISQPDVSLLSQELQARASLTQCQSSRCHSGVNFRPCSFHSVSGGNVSLSNNKAVASRRETEYDKGYVFTQRPIRIGEKLVVQVLNTLPDYSGGLAFGVTACDPVHLRPQDLPSDSDLLLDRKEYWVVAKDVASKPKTGDELAFYIGNHGEIFYYKNNSPARVIMHIDQTQSLWLFFDVYGNTQRIQIFGITDVSSRSRSTGGGGTSHRQQSSPANRDLINFDSPSQPPLPATSSSGPPPATRRSSASASSSSQLRVNLPPPVPPPSVTPRRGIHESAPTPPIPPPRPAIAPKPRVAAASGAAPVESAAEMGDECSICMSERVDCVLYTCGHMCMCFGCATEVRNKSGECPICRQLIHDVIKTYKT